MVRLFFCTVDAAYGTISIDMNSYGTKRGGFTIVELLIVIVVIGILAAISIVAYNGIQNRANDTAVQSDLRNFHNIVAQHRAINGSYPTTLTANMGIKFTRSAHGMDYQSRTARYCVNATTDQYIIYAISKSGKYYKYMSQGGLSEAVEAYGYAVCNQIGLTTTNPQFNGYEFGSWSSWVN